MDDNKDVSVGNDNDAFVFDYVPLGEPIIMSPRHERVMREQIERGAPVGAILRAMFDDRIKELRDNADTYRAVADVWRRSRVRAIQATMGAIELSPSDWGATLRDLAYWHDRERTSRDIRICTDSAELVAAHRGRRIGVMLGTQDTVQFEKDLNRVDLVHGFGVRVVQLTYNTRNFVGDGCTEREQSGLSQFGLRLLIHLDELGIIADVSHSGYRTTLDAIEHSHRPVAITHSCCKAVMDHPRAKSDEQLKLLRDKAGYLGIVAVSSFLRSGGGATLEDMMGHIDHAVTIMGVENVGIATDWGVSTPDMPEELLDASLSAFEKLGFSRKELPGRGDAIPELGAWTDWPKITAALASRGYSASEVRGLIGGNWLSFLDRFQRAGRVTPVRLR